MTSAFWKSLGKLAEVKVKSGGHLVNLLLKSLTLKVEVRPINRWLEDGEKGRVKEKR